MVGGEWSKGRTGGFDPPCPGSSPGSPATASPHRIPGSLALHYGDDADAIALRTVSSGLLASGRPQRDVWCHPGVSISSPRRDHGHRSGKRRTGRHQTSRSPLDSGQEVGSSNLRSPTRKCWSQPIPCLQTFHVGPDDWRGRCTPAPPEDAPASIGTDCRPLVEAFSPSAISVYSSDRSGAASKGHDQRPPTKRAPTATAPIRTIPTAR